jgi:hypothetical protein
MNMLPKMSADRKRAALYVALIFLCGSLTGTLVTNLWTHWGPESTSARADAPYSVQHIVERFTRRLNLTPEQAKQLNQILDETHGAYLQYESQEETIRQEGRDRIRGILTDEQRPKYEEMLARIDAKRKRVHR